jgi:plasmid maintenance system antidote protein VapI
MNNKIQNQYKEAVKDLSNEEIAESVIVSNNEPVSETEHQEFLRKRLELMNGRTKDELTLSNLLQFKYEVETYIERGKYDSVYSFSKCLKRYMQLVNKTSKDLTEELSIHKTRLSRILNDREEANPTLSFKLEQHSGQLLPAIFWWKLITLKKEHEIITDKKEKQKAAQQIKSIIKLRGKRFNSVS